MIETEDLPITHNSKETLSVCRNNNDAIDGSCIPTDILKKIIKRIEPNNNITSRKDMIDIINKKLNLSHKTEYLIVGLKIMNDLSNYDQTRLIHSFKPRGPTDKTWLSNFDINKVFENYELDNPDFKFLDATYNDFLYFPSNNKYKNLKFFKEYPDKNQFGMIINQDTHEKGGSHWVGLYFNRKGDIYYFDSVGYPPKKNVRDFINLLEEYFKNNNIKIYLKINNNCQQQGDSECGVYSTLFLIRVIEGEPINDIFNNTIPDQIMNMARKFIFNPLNRQLMN